MQTRTHVTVLIGSALLIIVGCGGGQAPQHSGAADDPWVFAGEDVWLPVIDSAVRDLGRASSALSEKRNPEAAAAIRDAASFFTAEAESGAGEARAQLKGAAAKLEGLAADLEAGRAMPLADFQTDARAVYEVDIDYRWPKATDAEWMPFVKLIQQYLESAHREAVAARPQEAAAELQKAAALLRLEAGRVGDPERRSIEGSWFELRQLASIAHTSGLADSKRLDRAAARACHALAQAHQEEAKSSWDGHRLQQTGQLLALATAELEEGLVWLGPQNEGLAATDAVDARRLAAELETGSPPPHKDEVVRVLENLGGSISTLGEMLKTPAPA